MQLSPLKQAAKRALKVADEAATPRVDPTPITLERPDQPEALDTTKEKTTSDSLDLDDPHWTET